MSSSTRFRHPQGLAAAALLLAACCDAAADSAAAPRAGRVTNGLITQERPTTGALLRSSGINHHAICSGTLIGCETFLTAAHCVCDGSTFASCGTPVPAEYSVFLQDVGLVSVSAIDVDPTFSFSNQGDVAVFTLTSPITGVAPTPINTTMRPPFGTVVDIAGYGLTRGGADDTGMLRRGLAETSVCTDAEADAHVCWEFGAPLDMPGLDSNTCNGDSGGPLFADVGGGDNVVGITSGGTSPDCLPTDHSYDADVYVHRAFIQGIGGADLLNASCGTIAQVGEVGADRATFDFDTFTKDEQSCRKEIAKQYSAHTNAVLKAWQSCFKGVADGSRTGPCPDADALDDLASADDKVDPVKLASKCPDEVARTIEAAGFCTGALDSGDLESCILTADDAARIDALAVEYANDNPMVVLADDGRRDCQDAIGRAGSKLLKSSLKAYTRCQSSLAAGKVVSCPDAKAVANVANAEDKARDVILANCSNGDVAALDGMGSFGASCAGAAAANSLATCQIAEHAAIRDDLLGLLTDQSMEIDVSFTVPPGATVLRVTLNGQETGTNDLDLFIRFGAPATTSLYDDRSENGGMFEETEIASPAAGTWYAHIERFSGESLIPYQLTATAFQP